jgi:apolipoprotein N-acyltransferase
MVRRLLAVAAGAGLYALALPPFDLAALAWVTLVPLLLVVRGRRAMHAFGYGAAYGFVMGWAITWWLAQAVAAYFGQDLLRGGVAMSAAYVVAVSSTVGIFAAGAAVLLRSTPGVLGHLAVAALWVTVEMVRGRLVAQPWALLGYSQYEQTALIQVAAVTGVYGVSFLLALGNVAIAEAVRGWRLGGSALRPLAVPAALVAVAWLGGAGVMRVGGETPALVRDVAVVQSNVPPAFEWTRSYAEHQLITNVRLTNDGVGGRPALIVWPENALTLYLEAEPFLGRELGRVTTRHQADLLLGGPRYEDGHTFNSARLIRPGGGDGGAYDKQRLVLFAETPPLEGPVAAEASESPRAFTAGRSPGVLQGFVPLGVSICHEILYPDVVHGAVAHGAQLLVNIANDGWLDGGFGVASRQHFAMSVFRAVEAHRYLVRAATTGVSGIIDPNGRILVTQAPGTVGVVTATVGGLATLTPYVAYGDVFAFACMALVITVLVRALLPEPASSPVPTPART